MTLTAAIWRDDGTGHAPAAVPVAQIKFDGGSTTKSMSGAVDVLSDAVTISARRGEWLWIRTYRSAPASITMCLHANKDTAHGEAAERSGAAGSDMTMAGTIVNNDTFNLYRPTAVLGTTRRASILLLGESLAAGHVGLTGEPSVGVPQYPDESGIQTSLVVPALPPVASINMAMSGMRLQWFLGSYQTQFDLLVPYVSAILIELGTNDFATGRTDAQMRTDLSAIQARCLGKPVFLATILPRRDTGGLASSAVRIAHNGWRRSLPAGFGGLVDLADVYEARDSNVFLDAVGFQTDNIHPNYAGYLKTPASGVLASIFR